MYESQINRVSQLIHDLHEEIDEVRKQNVGLRNANEIYSKQNDDLRKKAERMSESIKEESAENVRLVAQLENDEHNVGHLDEKMKRLDYLEKQFAENRYVFSDIPNTPENMKMVKMMKKYINKRKYTMRWRGQYLLDGENWKKYTYGQPLSKSKCIRVYIDNKPYQIDNVEGFNANEVDTIIDALNCWEDKLSVDFYKSDTVTQLLNYFESMRLHLENSASKPIKDNVNIVIPKGEKNCHTQ